MAQVLIRLSFNLLSLPVAAFCSSLEPFPVFAIGGALPLLQPILLNLGLLYDVFVHVLSFSFAFCVPEMWENQVPCSSSFSVDLYLFCLTHRNWKGREEVNQTCSVCPPESEDPEVTLILIHLKSWCFSIIDWMLETVFSLGGDIILALCIWKWGLRDSLKFTVLVVELR